MAGVTNDLFDQWEREWRLRLVGHSLVSEADVDPDTAIRAFRILGRNWLRRPAAAERKLLARKYRAVLLVGLCTIGSRHYDAGTFWDHVWTTIGAEGDPNRQSELAEAFRDGLSALGLSRFTLRTRRNVGEILLHGGVPINSVGAFARVLVRWDAANPSGDARSFMAWMSSMSQQVAAQRGLDVPTWLFLTEAGDIAEDFVERCLVALDHASGATVEEAALPPAVLEQIAVVLDGAASPRAGRAGRQRLADATPTISFSPQRGVQVRLPPLEALTESDIEWFVTTDGVGERIESSAPWPGDVVEPKFVTVRTPVKRAVVQVAPSDQMWDLDIIDVEDPLLVFHGDSRTLIPPRNSLPRGRVWVGFLNDTDTEIRDRIETDGELVVVEQVIVSQGWEGWSFANIDLTDASKLRIKGTDRWRYVSTVRRPRLLDAPMVEHVETRDGRYVHADIPVLELPGTGSDSTIVWLVSVTGADGRVIASREVTVGAEPVRMDPWAGADSPVVGDFVVAARGPLGRGAIMRVAIAEGFTAEASTDFRWMRADGRGLDEAVLSIRSQRADAAATTVSFDARRWRRATVISSGVATLDVIARLPAMSTSAVGSTVRAKSGGPIPLDLESLAGTTLRVDVPAGSPSAQLAAVVNDKLVQAVSAVQLGGMRSFALGQLSDTLESHRFAQLRLVIADRSVPVAYVRPRKLASGVVVDGCGVLTLDDAQPVEGLMALAYPRYAPWKEPTRLDFPADAVSLMLPEEVRGEGAATFVLGVANPWVPLEVPPLPDWSTRNAFVSEWGEPAEPADLAEAGFRSWLARREQCPASAESLPVALKIYTIIPQFAARSDFDRLRTDLATAVRSSRERVVEAVLHSRAQARDLFRLFVEAGVVTVPREDWRSSELLWSFSPALGIVADTDDHTGPDRDRFRDNLVRYAGSPAIDILDAGRDPFETVGRFGRNERLLDPMPQERIDALMAVANFLPKGLLDEDSRAQASKSLFDHRRDRSLDPVIAISRTLIAEARTAVVADIGAYATGPIDSRASEPGWMSLPTLSLCCAFVARLSSRGLPASSKAFEKVRRAYMRLAEAAPEIVQQDLGLAELWITRWSEQ